MEPPWETFVDLGPKPRPVTPSVKAERRKELPLLTGCATGEGRCPSALGAHPALQHPGMGMGTGQGPLWAACTPSEGCASVSPRVDLCFLRSFSTRKGLPAPPVTPLHTPMSGPRSQGWLGTANPSVGRTCFPLTFLPLPSAAWLGPSLPTGRRFGVCLGRAGVLEHPPAAPRPSDDLLQKHLRFGGWNQLQASQGLPWCSCRWVGTPGAGWRWGGGLGVHTMLPVSQWFQSLPLSRTQAVPCSRSGSRQEKKNTRGTQGQEEMPGTRGRSAPSSRFPRLLLRGKAKAEAPPRVPPA